MRAGMHGMKLSRSGWFALACLVAAAALSAFVRPRSAAAQDATPAGPRAYVFQEEPVNVRSGPGTEYDLVGILAQGQSGAIIGRSPNGFWLKIVYIGGPANTAWVFRDLVRIDDGDINELATVLPPPTPTPGNNLIVTNVAATSVASVSQPTAAADRPPTFTPPPPVVQPTLPAPQGISRGGFPPALLIISLAALGVFAGLISLLGRRV